MVNKGSDHSTAVCVCSGYSPVRRFNRFKSILSPTLLPSPLALIFFFCHPKWGARQRRGALEETNTYFIPGYLLDTDTAVFQALAAKEEEIYLHAGHPASQSAAALIGPQLKSPACVCSARTGPTFWARVEKDGARRYLFPPRTRSSFCLSLSQCLCHPFLLLPSLQTLIREVSCSSVDRQMSAGVSSCLVIAWIKESKDVEEMRPCTLSSYPSSCIYKSNSRGKQSLRVTKKEETWAKFELQT